ncbi:MAG TPA: hypothetical protein VFC24_16835 [Casimicrobiaceae bacterium]|nr:hypothetical protein [Casimicrobiaceae bacterium]
MIHQHSPLQALAIRYFDGEGEPTTATFYANLNFLQCVWRMTREPRLRVRVTCAPAVDAASSTRRALAANAEAFIRRALA